MSRENFRLYPHHYCCGANKDFSRLLVFLILTIMTMKQDKLDKRAAALRENMRRRKDRSKELKQSQKDNESSKDEQSDDKTER